MGDTILATVLPVWVKNSTLSENGRQRKPVRARSFSKGLMSAPSGANSLPHTHPGPPRLHAQDALTVFLKKCVWLDLYLLGHRMLTHEKAMFRPKGSRPHCPQSLLGVWTADGEALKSRFTQSLGFLLTEPGWGACQQPPKWPSLFPSFKNNTINKASLQRSRSCRPQGAALHVV